MARARNTEATFLISGLRPTLRQLLEEEAQAEQRSIQDVIRSILCAHYELDCAPVAGWIRRDAWDGSATILLKMQEELFQALKADSRESGESMQSLVHQALEAHYASVT